MHKIGFSPVITSEIMIKKKFQKSLKSQKTVKLTHLQ